MVAAAGPEGGTLQLQGLALLRLLPPNDRGVWEVAAQAHPPHPSASGHWDLSTAGFPEAEVWLLGWRGDASPAAVLSAAMINPGSGLEGPELLQFPSPPRLSNIFTMALGAEAVQVTWLANPPAAEGAGAPQAAPPPASNRETGVVRLCDVCFRIDSMVETNVALALRSAVEVHVFDPLSGHPVPLLESPQLHFGFEWTGDDFRGDLWRRQERWEAEGPARFVGTWLPPLERAWRDPGFPRPIIAYAGMNFSFGSPGGPLEARASRAALEAASEFVEDFRAGRARGETWQRLLSTQGAAGSLPFYVSVESPGTTAKVAPKAAEGGEADPFLSAPPKRVLVRNDTALHLTVRRRTARPDELDCQVGPVHLGTLPALLGRLIRCCTLHCPRRCPPAPRPCSSARAAYSGWDCWASLQSWVALPLPLRPTARG